MSELYFTIPRTFVRDNVTKRYDLNPTFYTVFSLIAVNSSNNGYSWLKIRNVHKFLGYSTKNKTKVFFNIIDSLQFMVDHKIIQILDKDIDLNKIGFDYGITIKTNPKYFNRKNDFIKVPYKYLKYISHDNFYSNKENVLLVLLYICSFIMPRCKLTDGSDIDKYKQNNPEAMWRSINTISEDIGLSTNTIIRCIKYLTSNEYDHNSILLKKTLKSFDTASDIFKNSPSIYVINNENAQQELKWAFEKIKSYQDNKKKQEI